MLNLDLSLFTTKTLVEKSPRHICEVRKQIAQGIYFQAYTRQPKLLRAVAVAGVYNIYRIFPNELLDR